MLVVSIGEVLWDIFGDEKRLGGASANFLWHSRQFGADVELISAVGNDDNGREIIDILHGNGIGTDCVEILDFPTGIVNVVLDDSGKPTYDIVEGSAWDNISVDADNKDLVAKADVIHFGSLAQRNHVTADSMKQLLNSASKECIIVFDINLRQSYYNKEIIQDSLEFATILKLSDEELPVVSDYFSIIGETVSEQLQNLLAMFNFHLIAYTCGPDGSMLVTDSEIDIHPGCPGNAVNSVGAGDSFLAALTAGIIRGDSLVEINDFANRVATFVCSQDGATPVLPDLTDL